MKGGAVDDMDPIDRADTEATIATYTIDRLSYSASPPIVFAVLDFDGGGRFPSSSPTSIRPRWTSATR